MAKYVCTICGYIYDESLGDPDNGVAPGTKWEDVPEDWLCPLCAAEKSEFEAEGAAETTDTAVLAEPVEELRELTQGELSALCSNLAKGCEKQYLEEEAALFAQLAEYYRPQIAEAAGREADVGTLLAALNDDIDDHYPQAFARATADGDRGALRALTWGDKVTKILKSLLQRYESAGGEFLKNTNVYICEICGFVYVGDEAPDICPICKVPKLKIAKVS